MSFLGLKQLKRGGQAPRSGKSLGLSLKSRAERRKAGGRTAEKGGKSAKAHHLPDTSGRKKSFENGYVLINGSEA